MSESTDRTLLPEASASPTGGGMELSARRRRLILVAMCGALALVVAGTASLSLALPEIARDTAASQTEQTWIVDAYMLTFAGLLLTAGALGDKYGRRGVLVIGLAVFAIAFLLGAFQDSAAGLIAVSLVAGVGAAGVMPVTLSVITTSFPEEEKPKAVGIWAGVAGGGAVLGLLAAGLVLEVADWPAIYAGFAAVAGLVALGAWMVTPSSRDADAPRLDVLGAILSAITLASALYAVIEAPEIGYTDSRTLTFAGIACVGLAAFVLHELRTDDPLLDVRLFQHRGFGSGTLSIFAQFLAAFGFFFATAQFTQIVLGYSTLESALAIVPMGLAVPVASTLAQRAVPRLGFRVVGPVGLVLMAVGCVILSTADRESTYGFFLLGLVPFGLGFGAATAPATTAIVSALPLAKQGVASAVNDTARELGAAIGLAVLGSVISDQYGDEIASTADRLDGPLRGLVSDSPAAGLAAAQDPTLVAAIQDAFTSGWEAALLTGSAVLILAAVVVACWAPARAATRST